jgi:toxin ParE1/3/4
VAKPVQLRRRAADDIDAALDHHRSEAGRAVAVRFVDAVERALIHVARHPRNGSLRFAYELGIPELRCWPIPRFPYLIFYVDHDNQIDVWRVLHTRRDVPAALADASEE